MRRSSSSAAAGRGLILVVGLILLSGSVDSDGPEKLTIIRDRWGIAHVFATTDAGALFGAGYATAQDRLYQMHRTRRVIQGRLAELVGLQTGTLFATTVEQDKNFRHRQLDRYARDVVKRLDPRTRDLLQAYSDGVNVYMARNRDQVLSLFGGQMPEPWEPADCLGAANRVADYFASAGLDKARLQHEFERLVAEHGLTRAIELFAPRRIVDEDAAVVKPGDVPAGTRDAIFQYARSHGMVNDAAGRPWGVLELSTAETPRFSHAWVVGGSKSTTRSAVLHSDPQTAIASPSIWYEIHVKGGTFDARGIGVAGSPGFLIGWNGDIAWGLSALGADTADLFELKMVGPDRYEYDGLVYTMDVREERVAVKDGADVAITVRDTILGPVVTPLCQDVRPGEEFVWKALPNADRDRHTVQAQLAMLAATDMAGFQEAIALWRHPGAHIVFGDRLGNIGYWLLAAIPVRSAQSPVGGRIAQDGSRSVFDWQDTLPARIRPHVINPAEGAIWTANHLPVGSWYPIPLYLGTGGGGDTVRSWRLSELLGGVPAFTPSKVFDVHVDRVNPAIREIVRAGYHARDVLRRTLSPDARNTLRTLESWFASGARSDTIEPVYAVALHVRTNFREADAPQLVATYGGGENGLVSFLKTLKRRLDDNPEGSLEAAELAYVDAALAAGWTTAVRNYGSDPAKWPAGLAAGPGTYRIPYFNTLEGYGSLERRKDAEWKGLRVVDGATILSQRAQSYSQWVDLSAVNESLSLLPVGLGEQADGSHFADQGDLWLAVRLRAAPLDRRAVELIAERSDELEYARPVERMNHPG